MLEIASNGGARVLGRYDLITDDVGKSRDKVFYDVSEDLSYAGAYCDPRGSLVGSGRLAAKKAIVNGKTLIDDGQPQFLVSGRSISLREIFLQQQELAERIGKQMG